MKLNVRELCLISLLGALEFVIFTSFSTILYLECITFTIVVVALNFPRKIAILSSLVFTLVNLGVMGVTPWSLLYALIYPCYSLLIASSKSLIKGKIGLIALSCAFLSFLTGQLLELPYLLVSKKVTMAYMIVGMKTSFIQGTMSGLFTRLCYPGVARVINRRMK